MKKRSRKPSSPGRPGRGKPAGAAPSKPTPAAGAGPTGTPGHGSRAPKNLSEARRRIDALDRRLVRMLNERAALVVKVGQAKRAAGLPIYTPHREAEVLDKAIKANTGPLPDRALEGVYRELMSGSFALQQPLRIGYLGPPGSYSHMAAVKHFGSSVEFEDLHEIAGVFTEVQRGHVNYGLAPIENSTGGGIVETLDAFIASGGDISICSEVQIAVHHSLLANCPPRAVRRIHSKPEVFSQCRTWLATQYPRAELIPAASSSRAVRTAAEEVKTAVSIGAEPGSAAIGSELAGQIYGLKTLFAKIEDNPSNITRFFVISRQKSLPTGDDKTSIMFNTADKPGALVSVLQVFERAGINLSHIDKRPSGRVNWTYTFFIDAKGHRDDPAMAGAIEESASHCRQLHVLGSYPRSKRIL
ncbi:MAG: prephenate dehydratase [Phycisphaeraceae bacterium]|nr:prephenate dehydratase [Phycisphaerae bacterium]MBX3392442.1 prephenate dehydratase [Phycisphaeraceae bacterium]